MHPWIKSSCVPFVLLVLVYSRLVTTEATICCAPDQWEGQMYLDFQQVFIDKNTLYVYDNGSVNVAYDFTNSRTYYSIIGTQLSPLVPNPVSINSTTIIDYKQNIQYSINGRGECEKSTVDQNMTKQCIRDNGILQRRSRVGEKVEADTYILSLNENFSNVRATVQRGTCLPIHMVYYIGSQNPDSGSVFTLDILSIKPEIINPSLFIPPSSCQHVTSYKEKRTPPDKLQSMLGQVFHRRMLYG